MVIVTGRVRATPDTLDEALALAREHVERSRVEPGCLEHRVLCEVDEPSTLVFFERWADRDALGDPLPRARVGCLRGSGDRAGRRATRTAHLRGRGRLMATTTRSAAAPARAGLVLLALILVAAVANLNLAVANVALPDIGRAFDASQTQLNLVAVAYSLGLAASVLWLGALGDHHGRKMMLLLGVALSVPACIVAAWAPSIEVLIGARLVGGVAAGMAYPTTLALITALWSGPGRTRSIALWSALGGAISALGPARRRPPARELLVGLGLPRHAAARRAGVHPGVHARAQPRERVVRPGRQPRRGALRAARGRVHPRHQLRRGARQGLAGGRPGCGGGGGAGGVRDPSAPGRRSRSTT